MTRRLASGAAALAAAALCLAPGPSALWRFGEIGAGRGQVDASSPNDVRRRVLAEEALVLWEEDGRESSIALRTGLGYSFSINGKTDGNARRDASTQVMAPLVGAMLHPQPQRALVIGLGTGSSAGWLAAVPAVQRVDVVELEPAVARVARDCAPVNHGVLDNPKVRLHLGDGREHLLTSDERWDLIFSEPSNPYRAGVASLFTVEFYRAAAARLAPGGLLVQWLQAYEVDASTVASVYASLTQVFPEVETWSTNDADLLLIASPAPLRHDPARDARRAAAAPFAPALANAWGVSGVEGFYAGFIAGPAFARRMAAAAVLPNVDDRPVIEFGFARSLGRGSLEVATLRAAATPAERSIPALAGLDWEQVAAMRKLRDLANEGTALPSDVDVATQARWMAGIRGTTPERMAGSSIVAFVLQAELLADRGDERAEGPARSLLPTRPVEGRALLARYLLRRGRRAEGLAELERALVGYRRDPWPWPDLMRRLLDLALEQATDEESARRLLAAVSEPFSVGMFESRRALVRLRLAERAGGDACRAAFRALEPNPLWDEEVLRKRARCYLRTGDPLANAAVRDLQWFLDDRPPMLQELLPAPPPPRSAAARPTQSAPTLFAADQT